MLQKGVSLADSDMYDIDLDQSAEDDGLYSNHCVSRDGKNEHRDETPPA